MTPPRVLSCVARAAVLLSGCGGAPSSDEDTPRKGGARAQGGYLEVREPAATRCVGELGAVEVEGDLLVPRDRTCELEGTAIGGRTIVSSGASLYARDSEFGEGISAHWFRRVELLGGRAEGRPRAWSLAQTPPEYSKVTDFDFVGGGRVSVQDGPGNGSYHFLNNSGRVEVTGLGLDLGHVYCFGNTRRPVVSGISGESPAVVQGQCAGLRSLTPDSDF
ncbi:hypothetical protein [Nocardioides sp. AX2bis]|uniref:hypothetical protein n=1 Tax=Nocardioides sp. AX2bis TaxID=2653157 RepID=UPI0012F22FEA|nr:hypothetical protein [Nocardioides sp. AX2bis]VXB49033.1 hypothetical protein NOCARDAX2BIS_230080 [Nocardioides sp. AX2bis]